jgi:16S rRNA (cytidine1402-2'-O)-methyltransferase
MPLFVVATPIGNLEDLSSRARRVLGEVDAILAEDTRHTRVLLDAIGVRKPLRAFHDHSTDTVVKRVVDELVAGATLAIVSDAGTPCVSDPGYELVRAAREAGVEVIPIPGASSVVAFLSAAGLPSDRFTFMGFAPRSEGQRRELLAAWMFRDTTLVFLESPKRVADLLASIGEIDGSREVVTGRELTKLHESFVRGTASSVLAQLTETGGLRGEFVVGIAPGPEPVAGEGDVEAWIEALCATTLSTRDIAALVSSRLSKPKDDIYRRVLARRKP